MPFKFPFTNYHELNLDWIIKKIEEITKIFEESSETITIYEERLADAEQDAADALAAAGSAVITATQADTAASAASTAASAASAAAAQAQIRAGQAEAAADAAQQTAIAAQIAAENAESIVQNFVVTPSNFTIEPDIYTVTYDPNNTTVSPASLVFYSYVFVGGVKSPYTAAKLTAYAVHDGLTMPASQVDVLDASSLTFPVPAYLDKDDYIVVKAFKSPEAYVYQEVAFLTVPVIADGENGKTTCITMLLDSSSWYRGYLTVTATGILADETKQVIQIAPASTDTEKYISAGIRCIGQSTDSLDFMCLNTPADNITVYAFVTEVL